MAEAEAEFLADTLAGLARPQKSVPGKYLWDQAGSLLFEQVCRSEHYYVARRESRLLSETAGEIAQVVGSHARLVEFGSGASDKVRILLGALPSPQDYPQLRVLSLQADDTSTISLPPVSGVPGPTLGFFPGTTAGNFDEDDLVLFLQRSRLTLGSSWLLVRLDPNQDPQSLSRAYGEATPAMARFHQNVLARMMRELGGDLDPDNFQHEARITGPPLRVEAHLVVQRDAVYRIGPATVAFCRGESIHTDNSRKYTPEAFRALSRQAGWIPERYWLDAEQRFSLHRLRC